MQIIHKNVVVGNLIDPMPDMWYLEGSFKPVNNENGKAFVEAISKISLREAYADPKQGIRTRLKESEDDNGSIFIVMSYVDGVLFGRRVFESEAVAWAIKNVPE